jgi:hypothetical protein
MGGVYQPHKFWPQDGSELIKYFNPETRKVLTSRNYKFLTNLPNQSRTLDSVDTIAVELSPAVLCEGEHDNGNNKMTTLQSGSQRNEQKRQREESRTENEDMMPPQRKLRTTQPVNYRKLNDPFSDEDADDETHQKYAETVNHAILGTDDPSTVAEARTFADWPEWENAIKAELDQLTRFGTWKLVECPDDAVPIPNKWVFLKKYNKQGELVKHKARLVVKGCAQRPGFDYTDTFAPVVCLEMIWAILSLVPSKKLRMHQMDVKGAYLNGILKERVYMRQPDGFGDGTNRVCWLQKTLYGLKQSGHEWNLEMDRCLKDKGFNNLRSDPCAYICRNDDDLEIITVWVDDFMLFVSSDRVMEALKGEPRDMFDVTDLGEPLRIVGIEIGQRADSITISQPLYVNSILRKCKMEEANPVSTLLDPNGKLQVNKNGREPN